MEIPFSIQKPPCTFARLASYVGKLKQSYSKASEDNLLKTAHEELIWKNQQRLMGNWTQNSISILQDQELVPSSLMTSLSIFSFALGHLDFPHKNQNEQQEQTPNNIKDLLSIY